MALDKRVYDELSANNNSAGYRVLPCSQSGRYLDVNPERYEGEKFLKSIWSMRFEKTRDLIKQGYDVFITDIDSIWLKYVPLESLPQEYRLLKVGKQNLYIHN